MARRLLYYPVWSGHLRVRLGESTHAADCSTYHTEHTTMSWTKPEAEIVAVTMEVTAYVATL